MVQSCIKLEVGRKDADTSLLLSRPSHSTSLVHNDGISQGGETKYNHCRLPRGRGTVAAETGLSRWLSVLGLQTLGLPQHMEDANTGDMCHSFKWLKRTSIELMWRLIFCCCSLTLQLMVPTTLRNEDQENWYLTQIFLNRKFSVFLSDLSSWMLGKKLQLCLYLAIIANKVILGWTFWVKIT